MLDKFLITKEEIAKFRISQKNPVGLTCEKITQNPRSFNTSQIKNAIENINLIDVEEKIIPALLVKTIEFILRDFFLYMHQTGFYNRQFKLWKTLGNVTQCSISKLKRGLFKKEDINLYLIEFYIDPKAPCITSIVSKDKETSIKDFQTNLSLVLSRGSKRRLKGIFYFINSKQYQILIPKLDLLTNAFDPISKYDSIINKTKDVRLNVLTIEKENERYDFSHIYPALKTNPSEEVKVR